MSSIKVEVKQGIVRGSTEKLPNGKSYRSFSGIPFAKPPINELRFRSPQKLLKFEQSEIDCTKERDACFQKSTLTRQYVGSEDCLHLNVYVPFVDDNSKKLAVMVYIHGGGMKFESNSQQLYSPEYLLMENVIVVTINYRLHVLGFLTLPSLGISGNAGLKDQQMALEWVHENISSFNGDPDNICLFGESSGAASVHLQVLNPKSRKFIKSAICQSGCALNDWNYQGQTEANAVDLAVILGCKTDSIEEAYKTLMTASVKDLYDNCEMIRTSIEDHSRSLFKWRVVIEEESEDAFLTQPAIDLIIMQADQIAIPMIFGLTNGDGMSFLTKVVANKMLNVLAESVGLIVPRLFRESSPSSDALSSDLVENVKKFYFKGHKVSEKNPESIIALLTDAGYLIPQTIVNDLNARYQTRCKQFLYEFQFEGKLNLQKKLLKLESLPGACHVDDLFYLFGGELSDQVEISEDSRESTMRKLMCKLWTNFAKYGDPTPEHDNPLPFIWSPVDKADVNYLTINDETKMVRDLHEDRMNFWRQVYKDWNNKTSSKSKL